jgi:hypothetical protein
VDVLDGTALGGDAGPPELRVEVLDVEGEDLLRPGGGLVEHPPQDPLAQPVPAVGEQFLKAGARDRPVAAAGELATLQPPGGVGGQDLVALRPGGEGGQRG